MTRRKRIGKLLVFAALALLIWALDRRFGWSEWLSGVGLSGLQATAEENFPAAAALYTVSAIVGCVALALPGVTFAVAAALLAAVLGLGWLLKKRFLSGEKEAT